MPKIRHLLVAALAATPFLVAACEDPFTDREPIENVDVVFEAWALTGSAPQLPSALLVPQATMVRPDATGSFDIAFDIRADGALLVLPVSRVVAPLFGSRRIGLISATEAYNAIAEAPRSGWQYDSVMAVTPGGAFLAKVTTQYCQGSVRGQDVYAKFSVDSVIPAEHRIRMTARVNPNCGYRSLLDGIPEF